eukprot:GHRR01014870.1.p1 GENE.GHRR01014870.1~~GHRR01014870.1.p1  ORF type:complete len:126 (-),score=31.42 GHRR01014870.1:1039-1416(-)
MHYQSCSVLHQALRLSKQQLYSMPVHQQMSLFSKQQTVASCYTYNTSDPLPVWLGQLAELLSVPQLPVYCLLYCSCQGDAQRLQSKNKFRTWSSNHTGEMASQMQPGHLVHARIDKTMMEAHNAQ